MTVFIGSNKMIIDESAFQQASRDFDDLAERLSALRSDIDSLLGDLKSGFDTPAGRKFIRSCESNLLEPLERQRQVITHISQMLTKATNEYSTVFEEYRKLNNEIASYK